MTERERSATGGEQSMPFLDRKEWTVEEALEWALQRVRVSLDCGTYYDKAMSALQERRLRAEKVECCRGLAPVCPIPECDGRSLTPSAAVGEEEIKRFRVGDILFNDEQAKMFCDLALKGLRAETAPTEEDVQRTVAEIFVALDPASIVRRIMLAPSATTSAPVDPESEAANPVWDLVIHACAQAWPAGKLAWNNSPTELIVGIINERDEALEALFEVVDAVASIDKPWDLQGHGIEARRAEEICELAEKGKPCG